MRDSKNGHFSSGNPHENPNSQEIERMKDEFEVMTNRLIIEEGKTREAQAEVERLRAEIDQWKLHSALVETDRNLAEKHLTDADNEIERLREALEVKP